MIWWAGLRGAIAFALSYEVTGEESHIVQSTILVVCVISIIVLGGSTPFALEYLGIETGVSRTTGSPEAIPLNEFEYHDDSDHESPEPFRRVDRDAYRHDDSAHWFISFDSKWIKPVFSKRARQPITQQSN